MIRWPTLALLLLAAPACSQMPAVSAPPTAGSPPAAPAAKRLAPKPVAPVIIDGMRIEAVPFARDRGFNQSGGVIEAFDVQSGASLWLLKVYDVTYRAKLETDVQDVFITRLRPAGAHRIRVDDEDGRRWLVDLTRRAVTAG